VQTFVRHVEVFDGAEGHPLPGFPFTLPASTSHSTPLIHDIMGNGLPHIGVVTSAFHYIHTSIAFSPSGTGTTLSLFGLIPLECHLSVTA
jgi:hypothetical protein